ncbi:hypothetical protein N9M20_00145 [Gammaproteobacteria bacterium]|nr:hypothetical protein [Gammaproteobacteria bacterium]
MKITQTGIMTDYTPDKMGDINKSVEHISLVENELHFSSSTGLKENPRKTNEWILISSRSPRG